MRYLQCTLVYQPALLAEIVVPRLFITGENRNIVSARLDRLGSVQKFFIFHKDLPAHAQPVIIKVYFPAECTFDRQLPAEGMHHVIPACRNPIGVFYERITTLSFCLVFFPAIVIISKRRDSSGHPIWRGVGKS